MQWEQIIGLGQDQTVSGIEQAIDYISVHLAASEHVTAQDATAKKNSVTIRVNVTRKQTVSGRGQGA